ncbi:MAG: hypothetical protein IT308_05575 [Anaerolineaceae bacterium]|nr:hypothetical protein [Anaerolineaceae bacterium]
MNRQGSLFTFVAVAWVLLMGGLLFEGGATAAEAAPSLPVLAAAAPTQETPATLPEESVTPEIVEAAQAVVEPVEDQTVFAVPYAKYFTTQGVHGALYGQMAVDISGGKGAVIFSPINGDVTAFYIDQGGSTTLLIENQIYQVTLMHGLYSVNIGDHLTVGQPLGIESNQGNTFDMQGNSCRGRDCGYHTHLNVFDKRTGQNVDPFLLIPMQR